MTVSINILAKHGHILIVDDSQTKRLKMSMAVKQLGHTVTVIGDGNEALDVIKSQCFDLILLDIYMPVMGGFEVLTYLKSDKQFRDIPVIVISSSEAMGDIVQAIKLGAEDFLPTEFNIELLEARLDACLERKRLQDRDKDTLLQLDRLAKAAAYLDQDDLNPKKLDIIDIAERKDAIGHLAYVFVNKSIDVYNRFQHSRQQIVTLKGIFLLLIVGLCFGLRPVLSNLLSTSNYSVSNLAFFTSSLTTLFLLIACFIFNRRFEFDFSIDSMRKIVVWSVVGTVIPIYLLLFVSGHISGIAMSLIMVLEAVAAAIFAAISGLASVTVRKLSGILIALAGCIWIFLPDFHQNEAFGDIFWIGLAVFVPLAYAIKNLMVGSYFKSFSSALNAQVYVMVLASIIFIFISFFEGGIVFPSEPVGPFHYTILLFSLADATAYFLLLKLVTSAGSVFASQKAYTVVLAGLLWSVVILGEKLSIESLPAIASQKAKLVSPLRKRVLSQQQSVDV